jgi:hypothetical protein
MHRLLFRSVLLVVVVEVEPITQAGKAGKVVTDIGEALAVVVALLIMALILDQAGKAVTDTLRSNSRFSQAA